MGRPIAEETFIHFDFYTCDDCRRLITNPELRKAVGVGGTGRPCPCGGCKVRPANLRFWQWIYPRVWSFAATRVKALGWRGLWTNLQADVRRWRGEPDPEPFPSAPPPMPPVNSL